MTVTADMIKLNRRMPYVRGGGIALNERVTRATLEFLHQTYPRTRRMSPAALQRKLYKGEFSILPRHLPQLAELINARAKPADPSLNVARRPPAAGDVEKKAVWPAGATVSASYKGKPFLTKEQVHPEDAKNLTPLEFASKHGHTNVLTAAQKEEFEDGTRFYNWTAGLRALMKLPMPNDLLGQYLKSVGSKRK